MSFDFPGKNEGIIHSMAAFDTSPSRTHELEDTRDTLYMRKATQAALGGAKLMSPEEFDEILATPPTVRPIESAEDYRMGHDTDGNQVFKPIDDQTPSGDYL